MRILSIALLALLVCATASAGERKQRWIGKPITLKTQRMPVVDVLRLIGEASGFNLVIGDGVGGEMSALSWDAVPWDQALDVILKTKRLRARREGNLLRIMTHEQYLRELQDRE
jgi:type IV pilus assembly protein PilQ